MKRKIQKFFSMFKLSNLKRQIKDLGGELTTKNLILVIFLIFISSFIAGTLLKLEYEYILICIAFFIFVLPFTFILFFRADYENNRFGDVVEYMEQLIYAFHKNNKIKESLEDVYKVSEGNIKSVIRRMLELLTSENLESNVYSKAFAIMESEYKCTRLQVLHNFLVECERHGGENSAALNTILTDIRGWSERTTGYQLERKKARNDVILSIFLALFTCGLMTNLVPAEWASSVFASPLYQVVTCIVIILSIVIYLAVQRKVSQSYMDIELDGETSELALRKRQFLMDWNTKDHFKPMIIKATLLVGVIIVELALKLSYVFVIPTAVIALFVLLNDTMRKNSAVKLVEKEIQMMFPSWIRVLSLCLQTDNVHVAIQKSLNGCPKILKKDVETLIKELDEDPTGVKPYNNFLKYYNVPTLRLSINWLYSAAMFGTKDALSQLDYLIDQNNQLTKVEEKIRNENALAGINMWVFSPMVLAIFKLMVDLGLLLSMFLTMLNSYI